jgi:hypothetical protein
MTWKLLLVLVFALAAWLYFFTGTPPFGPKLTMKGTPISAIQLSMIATNRITASNQCARVIQTMCEAREDRVSAAPAFGILTLYYVDGTSNIFHLQLGSRLNELDLVGRAGSHAISKARMFSVLQSVGLSAKEK